VITVTGLKKDFGDFQALKGLNMHVQAGEVYGFIGQNGVGKTTTMNILAGLSRPTEGECLIRGKDVTAVAHPGDLRVGYLPEEPKFYPWLTARETLLYLSEVPDNKRVEEILRWTGLVDGADRRVGGFSRGMKQRLGIGVALVRNPDLFILDEPSSALDPEGRSVVLRLIKDLKNMGKTILFSTHILDDIERICDTVGMINDGRMVFEKPLTQLQVEHAQPVLDMIPTVPIRPDVADALSKVVGVVSLTRSESSWAVRVAHPGVSLTVMSFLAEHGIAVESFAFRKARLEDLFLKEVSDK
jgi:ABC-2 type transport system ATP-binding protein